MELGHCDTFIYGTTKSGPAGKNVGIFLLEKLKKYILNEKFNQKMAPIRAFFPKSRNFFPVFDKGKGSSSPSSLKLKIM